MVFCHTLVKPILTGFGVGGETILRVAFKVRDVELCFWQLVDFGEKLP